MRSRSGPNRPSGWCWHAIAWGSSPFISRAQGDDLFFGSELKAILVHPEIERRLSLDGLDCYLSLNYVPCPWTLVEGIEKLPPGSGWSGATARFLPIPTGACRSESPAIGRWSLPARNWTLFSGSRSASTCFRCSAGHVAEWRHRFFYHPALRGDRIRPAAQDLLDLIPGEEFRRNPHTFAKLRSAIRPTTRKWI